MLQGYEIFNQIPNRNRNRNNNSLVQDNYLIGPGDELIILIQGSISDLIKSRITNDGYLFWKYTPPIFVSGLTFKKLKDKIRIISENNLYGANVNISISSNRKINVTVSGEVNSPGTYNMNSFSTVLDALNLAKGIKCKDPKTN